MRKVFFFFFLFYISHTNAQWLTNGTSVYYNGGNVGIGTSSPAFKLDINSPDNDGATRLRIANTASSGSTAPGSFPSLELLGARGDANATFEARVALGTRRTSGTALSNQTLGAVLFGGQYGTDLTFQASKILYSSSIQGIAEGSFTSASAMPVGLAFFTGAVGNSVATTNLTYGTERMRITNIGNVGIGLNNPQAKLTVNGDIRVYESQSYRASLGAAWGGVNIGYGTGFLGFNLARNNHSDGNWTYFSDGSNNGGQVIYGNIFGDLLFSCRATSGNSSGQITDAQVVSNIRMRIQNDGKVIIGTNGLATPGNYRLYVEAGILTERVKVAIKTTTDWSDRIFDKKYKLMPLDSLENYVTTNKHLPEIPSAEEVVKEGVDLGEMNSKLLGKIEQLTLYIIDLNKKIDQQKKEIEKLKKQ
jgi:hypothetical protein